MDICLKNIECVRILCIHHPPDDSTYPLLSGEFSRFLELLLAEYSKSLIIAGDFNLHLGDPRDRNAKRFLDIWIFLAWDNMSMGPLTKKATPLIYLLLDRRAHESVVL